MNNLFKVAIEPERVAAIIIEPVQGEGGFYPEHSQAPLFHRQNTSARHPCRKNLPATGVSAVPTSTASDLRHGLLALTGRDQPEWHALHTN